MDFAKLDWLRPATKRDIETVLENGLSMDVMRPISGLKFDDNQARKLSKLVSKSGPVTGVGDIRIVLLADCNITFMTDMLVATALRYGLKLDVMVVEYTDIFAQVQDGESDLYTFKPDYVYMACFGALLQTVIADFPTDANQTGIVEDAVAQLGRELSLVKNAVGRNSNSQFIVQTLPNIFPVLFGNSDRRIRRTFVSQIDRHNEHIQDGDWMVVDIADLACRVGLYNWVDDAKYHWAKLPFSAAYNAIYCDWLLRPIAQSKGKTKKCLVLDLDNTLWGGVIGDDGLDGIELGQMSTTGETFLAGQRYYEMLSNRGVLLAACSKNDMENAVLPFNEHPEMVLSPDDISCFVANWNDKPSNLRAIAAALNIGLDSLVFLDDNPMERDIVRQELAEVAVPEIPNNDASLYPRVIEAAGYFESFGLTDADINRASDYKANARRAQIQESSTDLESYLQSLEMKLQFGALDPVDEERIVQLINRSNQFNLTTRRYTHAEIKTLYEGGEKFGFSVRLSDKFSDSGLVGILLCESRDWHGARAWEIDTWVMSCRVLGRRVEEMMLITLAGLAKDANVEVLLGRYIPTAKNNMVRDHYSKLGFSEVLSDPEEQTLWTLGMEEFYSGSEAENMPFELTLVRPSAG